MHEVNFRLKPSYNLLPGLYIAVSNTIYKTFSRFIQIFNKAGN